MKRMMNQWRKDYPALSLAENKAFHNNLFPLIGEQLFFNKEAIQQFFNSINLNKQLKPLKVLELGGAKGQLADYVLSNTGSFIIHWSNYELSNYMVSNSICKDTRYFPIELINYFWNCFFSIPYNVFVASHVIEHMLYDQVTQLIQNLPKTIEYIYLDIPIDLDKPKDWTNYAGPHIFEKSWIDIFKLLNNQSFFSYQVSDYLNKSYKDNYRWHNADIYFFKRMD